jgi:hypothetical protein
MAERFLADLLRSQNSASPIETCDMCQVVVGKAIVPEGVIEPKARERRESRETVEMSL